MNGESTNQNDTSFRPSHPDLPSLTHALLVFMVGIAVLYYAASWTSGFNTKLIELLSYLLIPLWACYMFQFDVNRTFFIRFPGWRSWCGMVLGAIGMLVLLTVLESLLWSVPALQPSTNELKQIQQQLQQVIGKNIWTIVFMVVIAIPICEELLFRGFLLRAIRESSNIVTSVILIGIFFGLLHRPDLSRILISLFGIYLGAAVWLSNSIITSIMIHMLHNYLILLVSGGLSAQVKPDFVFLELPLPYQIATAVGSVLVVFLSLYLFYSDSPSETRRDQSDFEENELYSLAS